MLSLTRNTDRDWRLIGAADPYWGVISQSEYRRSAITTDTLEPFYESGRIHLESLNAHIERLFGTPLKVKRVLDFGCGVGRISSHMHLYADEVTGVDVSPAMLEKARARSGAHTTYTETVPDTPFDWLHSFIVFQHIPPARGLKILNGLLKRLSLNGLVTLHFTVARAGTLKTDTRLSRWIERLRVRFRQVGRVSMFDYDIGDLTRLCYSAGIHDMTFVPTDHSGHLGIIIIGRKTSPATQSF